MKYPYWHITFIMLLKCILKMAQFALFGSRQEMLARSFSIKVGVVGVDTVDKLVVVVAKLGVEVNMLV